MASFPNVFKTPSLMPQDLQLIQSLIGDIPTPGSSKQLSIGPKSTLQASNEDVDDDIASSGDEDSEKEVEENILGVDDDDETPPSRSLVL